MATGKLVRIKLGKPTGQAVRAGKKMRSNEGNHAGIAEVPYGVASECISLLLPI
jgi:hypothetical protein